MAHTTDDSERDPNAHDDCPPIITVDWAAVEDDTGHEIEPEFRRRVEHTGSINGRFFDKLGYDGFTSSLVDTVREYGRLLHPDRGALDARHAPLSNMGGAIGTLRNLRGDNYQLETIIEDGDDAIFIDGLVDLYDAVCALDERHDWPNDYPKIAFGDYRSDRLGNHYIPVMHPDREIIENIDVTNLPIELHTFNDGESVYYSDDYYHAEFRHERYYPEKEEKPEPTIADKRAEEIGFLGGGTALLPFKQLFSNGAREYREIAAPDVGRLPDSLSVYEYKYEYEEYGKMHYDVEWTEQSSPNDFGVHYLMFDHEPSESDIQTALLVGESWQSDDRDW